MPDSQMAFSSGYDRYIKIWDLTKGLVSKTMLCTSSCNDAAVSRDGWMLSRLVMVWGVEFGYQPWTFDLGPLDPYIGVLKFETLPALGTTVESCFFAPRRVNTKT
jgi:hypothetical protein